MRLPRRSEACVMCHTPYVPIPTHLSAHSNSGCTTRWMPTVVRESLLFSLHCFAAPLGGTYQSQ